MKVTVGDTPLKLKLYGAAKTHDSAKSYGEELIELLNVVWESVRSQNITTTGINHAVYGDQGEIFAGVEITMPGKTPEGLILREITLPRHAYYKYIGPYEGIPQAHSEMRDEVERLGLVRKSPVIEIYGHWTEDTSKLETELIYACE